MLYVLTGFKWFIGASCPEMVQKKSTSFRRVFFIFHQFSENDSPSNYMVHFRHGFNAGKVMFLPGVII